MNANMINYAQHCEYRLPCGICQRTNTICPLQTQGPTITSVYVAPVYPDNYKITETCVKETENE